MDTITKGGTRATAREEDAGQGEERDNASSGVVTMLVGYEDSSPPDKSPAREGSEDTSLFTSCHRNSVLELHDMEAQKQQQQQQQGEGSSAAGSEAGVAEGEAPEDSTNQMRAIVSSIVGNTLEWIDFLLYAFLHEYITQHVFPPSSQLAQDMAFYGVFAGSFLVRPLGALIFGWVGDRYGRKPALMSSMLLMTLSTALVAAVPTYEQIGPASTAMLTVLRLLQGFSVGGEFTHAMIMLGEVAPLGRQALVTSLSFTGIMGGAVLGCLVVLAFRLAMPEAMLKSWGWRLPFLVSLIGAALGLWVRRRLQEPRAFARCRRQHQETPAYQTLKQVLLPMVCVFVLDALVAMGFYMALLYMPSVMVSAGGLSENLSLGVTACNLMLGIASVLLGGWLSDRFGAFHVILWPNVVSVALSYPAWLLFTLHSPVVAWMPQALVVVCLNITCGALAWAFVCMFPPHAVCKGLSVAHNLSMALLGGAVAMMATGIVHGTGNVASPGILIAASSVISLAGLYMGRYLLKSF